ncbi:MAG: hypothetical protein JW818_07775 [Pirellulales bacterium]|nr:hypothetical protein [Pirellulales bacterium]
MSDVALGIVITAVAGLIMGTSPWPLKLMRRFQYEQFGFISMFIALLAIPWAIALWTCPDLFAAIGAMDRTILIRANLFSAAWGIAQVLAMLCFARIGVSLTYGILCAVGASVGVITPMVFKASGVFAQAPDLLSKVGVIVMAGMVVMVFGVFFASLAGFGRERQQNQDQPTEKRPSGSFAVGLVMVLAAGVLSAGWGFCFNYSQGPVIKALTDCGASDFAAAMAVWTVVLPGAALVNILYPAMLMTKNGSWNVLLCKPGDLLLSVLYGVLFFIPSVLLGKGSLMLGALGASVGFGIVQGMLILGGQGLGFLSGEWRGVHGKPRAHIYVAIALLIASIVVLALANGIASG